MTSAAVLRRAAAALAETGDAELMAVAEGLQDFLCGRAPTLDAALDLAPGPGQRRLSTIAGIEQRDALLRQAAERFFPGHPAAAQAKKLATALARYEATAWLHDRQFSACPPRHAGTPRETAFEILAAGQALPSAERLRKILVMSCGYS